MQQENTSRKIIVFITLSYAAHIGGVEKQAQLLLERWASTGEEIWVITRRIPGCLHEEWMNGVRVSRVWSLWMPIVSWLTFSFSVFYLIFPRRRQIRSLWGLMLNVSTLAVVLAAQLFDRPAVVKLSSSGEGGNLKM